MRVARSFVGFGAVLILCASAARGAPQLVHVTSLDAGAPRHLVVAELTGAPPLDVAVLNASNELVVYQGGPGVSFTVPLWEG